MGVQHRPPRMRLEALVLLFLESSFCLLLKRIRVPGLVRSGRDASLHCDFDTQGEELYSVKWYKGGQEVFRWLPSQSSKPITIYPRPGVRIDQNKSSATTMALQAVDLSSTGRYRCEVSTEAPMFSTASDFGDLLVVSAPPRPPLIQGDIRVKYQPGDLVHLNCTSSDSKPAADLSWKINNQTADSSYIIPHPVTSSPSGLLTSVSELFLTLGKRHFTPDGRIRIECEARIGRTSQPHTSTTLATRKPLSSRPPSSGLQPKTATPLDTKEEESGSKTTLSSTTSSAVAAIGAKLKAVALNMSKSTDPIEASPKTKFKKKLLEINDRRKTEKERMKPKKATDSVL